MLPFSTVALFIVAALALLLIPGPSVLYIVARSVNQGRRAGLVSAAGVGAGSLVHVSAATLGLSALLLSSALAFAAVKYLGAAYLIYLGIRTLRARAAPEETSAPARRSLGRIFLQGVVVNTLNPKTALFYALLSGTLGGLLRGNRRFAAFQQYATGTVYIALGVSTALTGVGGRK